MYFIWKHSNDPLRKHIVSLDALEEREDRVVHLALPQQQVVHGASKQGDTRFHVEARMDHVHVHKALLPL